MMPISYASWQHSKVRLQAAAHICFGSLSMEAREVLILQLEVFWFLSYVSFTEDQPHLH